MEVSDLNDILNVRAIKMENGDNGFEDTVESVEMSDPLSNIIPQYVAESDLGLMQSNAEIFQTPLAMFDTADDDDTMQSNDSGEEVIVQLMDIRTRLSKLRDILEQRLGVDLMGYTFWLQDAKMLESHKTLVEQCIRGSGVVQVNLQIRPQQRKINILDVLKPDDEPRRSDYLEPEESPPPQEVVSFSRPERAGSAVETAAVNWVVDTQFRGEQSRVKIPDDPSECRPERASSAVETAAVNWVVDTQFRGEQSRVKIPDDPSEWSVQHVKLWIQWAVRQFNLTGIRLCDWNISGAELCGIDNTQFKEKVPSDPGDIFWTHFELLRKCRFIAVVQTDEHQQQAPKDHLDNLPQSAIKKKPKVLAMGQELEICTASSRAGNNGQIQLWQFLLDLLTSAEHYDVIRWHGTEGEFKLLEPERVARLWGERKHKPAMNYEKLSRALRYYYDGDMIAKVPGNRFVYKFVCDLRQLIGYSPGELADLVQEVHMNNKPQNE